MNEDHDTDGEPIGVTIQRRAIQGMERCIAQAKVLRHAAMTRCRIADLEEATDAKN